jgi:SPASM domain peptide maturase of grasp-with-spasm system
METKFLHIYSCVKVVLGKKRSLLQDLSSSKYYLIPNSLAEFIANSTNKNLSRILKNYKKEEHVIVEEYFDWLINNNLGVWLDNFQGKECFPPLNCQWDEPHSITNCLIDLKKISISQIKKIIVQIDHLRIPHVEVRIYSSLQLKDILLLIEEFQRSNITGLSILTKFHPTLAIDTLKKVLKYKLVLNDLCIFEAPVKLNKEFFLHSKTTSILFTKNLLAQKLCGYIMPELFNSHLKLYTESLTNNTCLNRKISIDENGEIKNCPSMSKSYGNIKDTTLVQALNKEGFKDIWRIKKDDINICRDCEFRHICTDCRAYLRDPDDMLSKPLKCGYDPYTNIWEDWAVNPLSKNGIEFYGLKELVPTVND